MIFNPSLNYFNGPKNLSIIGKLRQLEVHFSEEITIFNPKGLVDNVVMRYPGGTPVFHLQRLTDHRKGLEKAK